MINKPIISIIVATAENRVIGKDNDMPWGKLPIDLKYFKKITNGHPIIMGRKTFESIGKPLPGRMNIIISRNKDLIIDGCLTATSIQDAIKLAKSEEVFIIGGGEIYKQAIDLIDKFYLTLIDYKFEGDTLFPDYSHLNMKTINTEVYTKNEENKYTVKFIEYEIIK